MSAEMNIERILNHLITTSDSDYQTMLNLYETKDFHWALFMGHLVIERLLKAKIVKETKNHATYSHDLRKLYKISGIEFDDETVKWLDTITTFNLNARYDDYKQEFYKKCTKEFADKWIENIQKIRKWIKEKL
jgi:HEPN domain-containing protein